MSIDHSQPDSLSVSTTWLLRPSHRTRPEQIVGFFIFILISLGSELLNRWLVPFSIHTAWYRGLVQVPWAVESWPLTPFWMCHHFLIAASMWTLWRRFSLRVLKLELSVFLSQFAFQAAWFFSFFFFQQTLLALVALLLLFCNILLASLLFWKKERLSGQILILPLLWVFYMVGINMAICISNP